MNVTEPEKKRFRLPDRIKKQNEAALRRKFERALPGKSRQKKPGLSLIKLTAIWLTLLGITYLAVRYGIQHSL